VQHRHFQDHARLQSVASVAGYDRRMTSNGADNTPDQPLPPAPKPERPRDEAGRPLPWDQPNRLHLPYFDEMTLDECHAEAIRLFDQGNYFGAHEAWETCWGYAKLRGNPHGVVALLGRALTRLPANGPTHRGIDTEAFARRLEDLRITAARCEREATPLPPMEPHPVPGA